MESYLYTVETIQECLRHLTPGGILAMQFGELDMRRPLRTPRYPPPAAPTRPSASRSSRAT